jgi:hypothetical protein
MAVSKIVQIVTRPGFTEKDQTWFPVTFGLTDDGRVLILGREFTASGDVARWAWEEVPPIPVVSDRE